jgi:LPXTG-motif cell wall-anchored protein
MTESNAHEGLRIIPGAYHPLCAAATVAGVHFVPKIDAERDAREDARSDGEGTQRHMRKVTRALVPVVVLLMALATSALPASAQAAAPNCPPGQPFGRPPGTPPGNPPVPTGRPDYPPGRCQLALSQSAAARGDTFTATGGGFVPGESVVLSLGSARLTSVVADANGAFSVELTVPNDAPLGRTEVKAIAPSQELTAAFEVVAAPAASRSKTATQANGLLAHTGQQITGIASLGLTLVLIGVVLLIVVRRRRAAAAAGLL